jgi:hypothetical protein
MIKRPVAFFMSLVILTTAVQLMAGPTAIDPQRRANIIKLMQVTGAGDIGAKVLDQIICSFRQSIPTVPDKFWQDVRAGINQDSLIDLCIPIYDQALSDIELKEMIKFFESAIGKKFIDILPHVTEQSMIKGQEWGQEISLRIAQKLEAQGYDKANPSSMPSPKSPVHPKPPVKPSK